MSKEMIQEKKDGFVIDPQLLQSIRIIGAPSKKFEIGEVLNFSETEQVSKFNGNEYPVYSDGNGRTIALNRIGNFILADDSYNKGIENSDDDVNRCLRFGKKYTYLKDYMIENGSRLPKSVNIVDRISEASTPAIFGTDSEKTELLKEAYKKLGIDTELEHFPSIMLRRGKNAGDIDNWRKLERIVVEITD